ncbi:MAG: helix-turn-helix domain-containing protein [Desulfobacterales bacterium]|jgi:DNA-binding HxlR family transcriptional regulator
MIEIFQQILKCKWTLLILDRFAKGLRRPGELRRSISGLSSKVLYERLKVLETSEIIARELIAEKPMEVHYRLTRKGRRICAIIDQIKALD